jgi:hypothetical protein
MGALYQGLIVTGVLSAIALYFLIPSLVTEPDGQRRHGLVKTFDAAVLVRHGRAWWSPA